MIVVCLRTSQRSEIGSASAACQRPHDLKGLAAPPATCEPARVSVGHRWGSSARSSGELSVAAPDVAPYVDLLGIDLIPMSAASYITSRPTTDSHPRAVLAASILAHAVLLGLLLGLSHGALSLAVAITIQTVDRLPLLVLPWAANRPGPNARHQKHGSFNPEPSTQSISTPTKPSATAPRNTVIYSP
jgi:hypothetical protein